MKTLITQPLVKQMRASGTREEVWDTRVMNFFVQVRSSGVATFYVRYTMPGSTEKQSLRLGDAAVLRVADARLMAQRVLGQAPRWPPKLPHLWPVKLLHLGGDDLTH